MPIDLNSSIGYISQIAFGSPFLNGILSNTLFVAVLIALITCLLIMFLYPAKKDTSISVVGKIFIWSILSSAFVVFLHDSVRRISYDEMRNNSSNNELINGTTLYNRDSIYGGSGIEINPLPSVQNTSQSLITNQSQNTSHSVLSDEPDETPAGGYILGGNELLIGNKASQPRPNPYK